MRVLGSVVRYICFSPAGCKTGIIVGHHRRHPQPIHSSLTKNMQTTYNTQQQINGNNNSVQTSKEDCTPA